MSTSPEDLILTVFEKCAGKSGCDVCRLHMEEDCLFFPELYRLQDQAEESRLSVCAKDLRYLLDLCTLCGLCPCPDIRMLILQAKAAFIDEKGISLSSRIISDVETVGRWGTTFSTVVNHALTHLKCNHYGMGEYLLSIHVQSKLNTSLTCSDIPMVYYAPCHQREQEIGQPYYRLLKSFPGSDIIQIKGVMQCCGMGGHLGYKTSFHPHTLKIGQPLFERLLFEKDRTIITDCLSCRIQFQQTMSRKVFHPLEML